jgi:hypothetical protein
VITRFGLSPRRRDLPLADFQEHWRGEHARRALQLPGVRRYWQNHAVVRAGEPLLPWPGFDVCSEIDADDLAAFDGMFSSPAYLGPVREDEPRLIERAKGAFVLTRCALGPAQPRAGAVRLLRFYRAAPLRPASAIAEALTRDERGAGALAREVFIALAGAAAGQRASAFDAVEALWFATAQDALAYLRSPAGYEDRWALAGEVSGTEQLLAHVVTVV